MGTEKSFRLFRRWIYPAFLLLLLALSAQSQPLIKDKPANEQGDQNNGADNGINGGRSRQARSSGDQKTGDCPPGSDINGTCVGTRCVVECGNGKKVEMECPEEAINVTGGTATCGKKLEFPPCFPFCG